MDKMSYNYVVTAQKPTSITHVVTGSFTSAQEMNLIVVKNTRLEIHSMTAEGLKPLHDVGIYGRITICKLFRPAQAKKDWLLLCTQRYQFCVLEYDETKRQIVTRAHGDIKDSLGRSHDVVIRGNVDAECRLVGLHLYEGYFKIIPIDAHGSFQEAFNIRLDELKVIDIQFLHGYSRPTICVLYEDFREARHVKTYQVMMKEKEFTEGPWTQSNVEPGATLLIPVPPPCCGVIIVGQQTIVYHSGTNYQVIPMQNTIVQAYCQVDKDGSRYLLGDQFGSLHVVALMHNGKEVSGIHLEVLGQTSIASSISYLDNGVVFVGSAFGDSQVIKLKSERDQHGSYIEYLDNYTNIGPIVDFCVMDLDRQGQGQVVTCSGAYKDGSLRIVRNGIGITEQAAIELPGIKGMWSLRESFSSPHDKYLVQSYVDEIRILAIESEEMKEAEISGFVNTKTLCCQNMQHDMWIQVTESEVRLVSSTSLHLLHTWKPPGESRITLASASPTQVVVATSGGILTYLEVVKETLVEKTRTKLDHEIACIDISPFGNDLTSDESMADDPTLDDEHHETHHVKSPFCAVGFWTDYCVSLLSLPDLKLLQKEPIGADVLPRSVLMSTLEGKDYLLVGLGDGHLIHYRLAKDLGSLTERKKISLGTQPIGLACFRTKKISHVFASSDRPTVIYSSNGKLMFSNVNTSEVNIMCPFDSQTFPECLAFSSEETLTIGNIDDIQKLHIQTVPLNEWPRRICHDASSRTLGVTTVAFSIEDRHEEVETNYVRLFDDQTFELVSSYKLDPFESACAIISCTFAEDPATYFVVGTAYTHEEEAEPHQGRILLFTVMGLSGERKLSLVAERETKGAVYCLNAFNGKLLAGINSKTQLYKWTEKDEGDRELVSECGHHGHILVLYLQSRGDFIVVGDLMKSISLLSYNALDGSIEEIARDLNSNWMTAVEMLSDDVYIGSETDFNLFAVKRNSDAASDEERGRLDVEGEYHLGEFVNRFRHGSLVMQQHVDIESKIAVSSDLESSKHLLFGTVTGMIGIILPLTKDHFDFLRRIESAINQIIKGVGGFSHSEWRMFESKRKKSNATNFIDGDLVESFLELEPGLMSKVVECLNNDGSLIEREDMSVEEVTRRIEEISQMH